MSNISVVICAYNEEENISAVVRQTIEVLEKISNQYEIICVDDGSTDGTARCLKSLAETNSNLIIVTHPQKQGIGKSLKDAYQLAKYEFISWLAGDGQNSPSEIERFLSAIKTVDFVVSHYRKRPDSFTRLLMSRIVRIYLFILFGRLPRIEGPYIFRKSMLNKISLMSDSFVLNFEFVIKSCWLRFTYKEIEVECLPRLGGVSKVTNLKTIFLVLKELLILRVNLIFNQIYA